MNGEILLSETSYAKGELGTRCMGEPQFEQISIVLKRNCVILKEKLECEGRKKLKSKLEMK